MGKKKRIHFVRAKNLRTSQSTEMCRKCNHYKHELYEKGWIFESKLGTFCFTPDCDVDEELTESLAECGIKVSV